MTFLLTCLLPFLASHSEFFESLQKKEPCTTCNPGPEIPERVSGENLMVFMSFSVPLESWKDLSAQLERTGGHFVLNGLPDHSFEALSAKLVQLKAAEVDAPIDIDPESFEAHEITQVPTFVLENSSQTDKIVGNLRLDAALREMEEKGDCKNAKEIRERLSR